MRIGRTWTTLIVFQVAIAVVMCEIVGVVENLPNPWGPLNESLPRRVGRLERSAANGGPMLE